MTDDLGTPWPACGDITAGPDGGDPHRRPALCPFPRIGHHLPHGSLHRSARWHRRHHPAGRLAADGAAGAAALPAHVLVAFGFAIFTVSAGDTPHPLVYPEITERLTEIVVIVALTSAGLKLDRPFGWRSWAMTWRL